MVFLIMAFSLIDCILINFGEAMQEEHRVVGPMKYLELMGGRYQGLFGENPDPKEMNHYDWALYLVFTLIVQVVSFNLLISIVSDTYDRVKTEQLAIDTESKVVMMMRYSQLRQFVTRKRGAHGYLHFFHHNDHVFAGDDQDAYDSGQWEGRVLKMQRMQEQLMKEVKQIKATQTNMYQE